MKENYRKFCENGFMKVIGAIVCSVSAVIMLVTLCMLLFGLRGGYHGMTYEQMMSKAKQYAEEHLAGTLLTDLSTCSARDYNYTTEADTNRSFLRATVYWSDLAENFEGADRMDYAVILSETPEEGFSEKATYIYESEGFSEYSEYLQVQAFTECYYTEDGSSYSALLRAPYKGHWYVADEELPFGKPYYLTILFREKSPEAGVLTADQTEFLQMLSETDQNAVWILVIAGVFFALSLAHLCMSAGHRKGKEGIQTGFLDRIPFAFWMGAVFFAEGLIAAAMSELIDMIGDARASEWFAFHEYVMIFCLALFVMGMLGLALLTTFCVRIKSKTFWRTTLVGYIFRFMKKQCIRIGVWASEHLPLAVRFAILLPGLAVVSIIEAALIQDCGTGFAVLFVAGRLFSLALISYLLWGYSRLRDGAARIAAGELEQPVEEKYLTPDYRFFAKNLNSVGESIQIAVEERMKSERLKTALITNVSHDIKTPITSIINYVDLLSQSDATEEEKKEYLGILAHQSDRLKKLIQDLIDASKASSGAVEVNLSEVDLSTLVGQVTGEYQDKLDAANLTLVSRNLEKGIMVSADSNLLWRVLDNLFVNILKYAMPGTRVYTEASEEDIQVCLSISNISKAELGISGDELMERFVRGDASRNTEGSGLGLSIAKSLMERMGGDLVITVDGDMFKAVLKLKK